jgi:hypothetical protein
MKHHLKVYFLKKNHLKVYFKKKNHLKVLCSLHLDKNIKFTLIAVDGAGEKTSTGLGESLYRIAAALILLRPLPCGHTQPLGDLRTEVDFCGRPPP